MAVFWQLTMVQTTPDPDDEYVAHVSACPTCKSLSAYLALCPTGRRLLSAAVAPFAAAAAGEAAAATFTRAELLEVIDGFRAAIAAAREQVETARHGGGELSDAFFDGLGAAIDSAAARGANLVDVATGVRRVTP